MVILKKDLMIKYRSTKGLSAYAEIVIRTKGLLICHIPLRGQS